MYEEREGQLQLERVLQENRDLQKGIKMLKNTLDRTIGKIKQP